MAINIEIKIINQSKHNGDPSILVFMQPATSDLAANATAWQVIQNIGYNCWHKFTYTVDTEIRVEWDKGTSGTLPLKTSNGKNYALKNTPGGFSLQENGSNDTSCEFDVINKVAILGGISVFALKDGQPIAVKHEVGLNEKAQFVFHPKLYIGLSSEYKVGALVSSDTMSEGFTEISLEGRESVTLLLRGNDAVGYTFDVCDEESVAAA
jgi:hypothetical protein